MTDNTIPKLESLLVEAKNQRDVEYNRGVIVGWHNGCTYQEQVDREVIEFMFDALCSTKKKSY